MASILPIRIDQGADWSMTLVYADADSVPIDLTDYEARAQIRRQIADETTVIMASMVSSGLSHPASSIATGTITITAATGEIALYMAAAQTALIAASAAYPWKWDIEIIEPGGAVTRLVQGPATVDGEVTRG